jgi:hypothetical protein
LVADVHISPHHWRQKSLEEWEAAKVLHAQKLGSQAFQHAGFSIEFALKYRIMLTLGLNRWPDRDERRDLYVHDLGKLAMLAGVEADLASEVSANTAIGLAWMVAKDWTVETRYDPAPFPPRRVADMVKAIGEMGLLEWLIRP